jgi:hypothetical protein
MRKEGKPSGKKSPPQNTMLTMAFAMSLCPSPQEILQGCKFMLDEGLCKYVCNLFKRGKILQIDDPIMDQSSDEVHVNIYMFGSLSLYWISAKLQYTLIITPNSSRSMKQYTKLYEEVLQLDGLSCSIDCTYISSLS